MSVAGFELDAARLLIDNRWAALATQGEDGPSASMVAYAVAGDSNSLLLFLSALSAHTRSLITDPRVALVVAESDAGIGDPQTLGRLSLKGTAGVVDRTAPGFSALWQEYVSRLPDAAPRLALGDFSLFRIAISDARYVGGFARAGTIPVERLADAVAALRDS